MTDLALYDLRCEYCTNPLGIGATTPRLYWKLRTPRRGARQTAYQIRAASNPTALDGDTNLVWDSGRVASAQSAHVVYGGPPARSRERVYWRVRVWDEAGNVADSDTAWWETGLLERGEWEPARWIGGTLVGGVWTSVPLPYLRRAFQIKGNIAQARLYVTALGLYECWFNGKRVGQDWLTPGWTDYSKRVQYQVYDVTELLHRGENAWGALLGDGWYCGHMMLSGRQAYGDRPKFFAKLVITSDEGSTQEIVTDDAWQVHYGALLSSDNYNGESYDARREQPGWNEPGFQGEEWNPVVVLDAPPIELSATLGVPVRTHEELKPIAEPTEFKGFPSSRWVLDFGQNLVGRVRLQVRGTRGTTVRLRFAEVLNPDGTVYRENLRGAAQTDVYTLRGDGEEVWEPRFTFHGFRYVELQGLPHPPTADTLTAVVMHSATPPTGSFECSEPLVNQLQHNIVWGQKGNFLDIPTDCPQRDERLGWMGDAQVFIRTAAFNMDVAAFFWKWLRDVMDAQTTEGAYPPVAPRPPTFTLPDGGPAWADAGVICPWTIYQQYGDIQILERQYASMQRFFEFLSNTSQDGIRPNIQAGVWPGFGDWLALDRTGDTADALFGEREGATSKTLIGTAFFAHTAEHLAQIARVLGHNADAAEYARAFENIRAAFQREFVDGAGRIHGETQTGYVLALHFNLLPEELRAPAAQRLVELIRARNTHLATGFVGTPYLNHVLTEAGQLELAYQLLLQRTYPSWLFPVLNGATTIWERWDGWTPERGFQNPEMNSFNHYAYGAIGDWLYEVVAGIASDATQPGYKHILLQPRPGATLTSARATYESLYGRIASEWQREGNQFTWHIVVPPNSSATAYVPTAEHQPASGANIESAEGAEFLASLPNARVYQLSAGEYTFRSRLA